MPARVNQVRNSRGNRVADIESQGCHFQVTIRRIHDDEDGYRLWLQRFNTYYETEDTAIWAAIQDVEQLMEAAN